MYRECSIMSFGKQLYNKSWLKKCIYNVSIDIQKKIYIKEIVTKARDMLSRQVSGIEWKENSLLDVKLVGLKHVRNELGAAQLYSLRLLIGCGLLTPVNR